MSFAVDLSEHGSDLRKQYENVISSDPGVTWAVFGYDGSSNALKPEASGGGDLAEFVDAFDDARIQYGLARVEFNNVNKVVLAGWVGENVSARQRLTFNAHMSSVAKQFSGHHVQLTARSADELTPETIMEKVTAAAGSKYAGATRQAPPTKPKYVQAKEGAHEDDWVEVGAVEERDLTVQNNSGYKSSVREELEQLRKGKKPQPRAAPSHAAPKASARDADSDEVEDEDAPKSRKSARNDDEDEEDNDDEDAKPKSRGIAGLTSGTSYTPVGKIDLKKIRAEGRNSKFADARIEKIEPAYKPVGKVDLKAIREQARKEKELKARRENGESGSDTRSSAKASSKLASKEDDDEDDEPTPPRSEPRRSEPARRAQPQQLKKSGPRTVGGGDDDDEPQFASLADRMKAFQNSVSGAKPKFEADSRRPAARKSKWDESPKRSAPAHATRRDDEDDEDADGKNDAAGSDSDDAPLSVAAQLAKSRLSGSQRDDEKEAPASRKETSAGSKAAEPKAVSSFAARFAQQSASTPKDEPKDEPKAEPKASSTPGLPKRNLPSADDEFDDEPEEEPEAAPPAPRRASASASASASTSAGKNGARKDADEGLTAVATEEYPSGDDDEISLKEGERIINIEKVDENWWIGENTSGAVGLFPKDYVKLDNEDEEEASPEPKKEAAPPAPAPAGASASKAEGKTAIAQYDYDAGEGDELSFAENELITEVDFPSEDWWSGKNSKGDFGLFPSSYVTLQ